MLLAHATDLALDRARGLIMPVVLVRRGANDKTLVLDRIGRFRRLRTPAKERAPKRHAKPPLLASVTCLRYLPPLLAAVTCRRYLPPLLPAVTSRRYLPPLLTADTYRRSPPLLPL